MCSGLYPVGSVDRRTAIQFSHGKLQAFSPEILIDGHDTRQIWRTTKGIGPRLEGEKDTIRRQTHPELCLNTSHFTAQNMNRMKTFTQEFRKGLSGPVSCSRLCPEEPLGRCFQAGLSGPKHSPQSLWWTRRCEICVRSSSHRPPTTAAKPEEGFQRLCERLCEIRHISLTLTLKVSRTSLKFLFPSILFFIALTASLGLQTEQHHKNYIMLNYQKPQSTIQLN